MKAKLIILLTLICSLGFGQQVINVGGVDTVRYRPGNYPQVTSISTTYLWYTSAPTATAATLVTDTSFTANWGAVTGATSYRLDVSTASNFSSYVTGYEDKVVSGISQAVTDLTENTTYYYRVRAVNVAGASTSSGNITTVSCPQCDKSMSDGYYQATVDTVQIIGDSTIVTAATLLIGDNIKLNSGNRPYTITAVDEDTFSLDYNVTESIGDVVYKAYANLITDPANGYDAYQNDTTKQPSYYYFCDSDSTALKYDASNDFMYVPKKIANGSDDWIFKARFRKTNAVTTSGYIFDARDASNDGVRLLWAGSTTQKIYASLNNVSLIFTGSYSDGDYHDVVIWRKGNTLYGTVDSELQSGDVTDKSVSVAKNIYLGSDYSGVNVMGGFINYLEYYEFSDSSLKTTWKYPNSFGWSPSKAIGITFDESWKYSIDITDYKVTSPNDYYIKSDGSDENNGSTLELAKATMAGVFAQITTDEATSANIIVSAGNYTNAWGDVSPSVKCNIICSDSAVFTETVATRSGKIVNVDTVYIEGIHFVGKSFYLNHTATTPVAYFKKCTFRNATIDGLDAEYGGEIYLDSCIAKSNGADGFSYHADASGDAPKVAELSCQGINNGDEDSDNGSSIHDGGDIIRIAGTYTNNNRNIHDINTGTTSLNLSCTVNTSRGDANNDDSFNVGVGTSTAAGTKLWLLDCDIEGGAEVDLRVYDDNFVYTNTDVSNRSIVTGAEYHYTGSPSIIINP